MTHPDDEAPKQYVLEFEITPEIYKRAITQPIPGQAQVRGSMAVLRNGVAVVLMSLSLILFSLAFFDLSALPPMALGFTLGAVIVLGVWWKQHRGLVRVHMDVNAKAGQHHYVIDASGIVAARRHIRNEIAWPFVNDIRGIDGATLIEVQTARLIVPDSAVPGSPEAFRAQMNKWRAA